MRYLQSVKTGKICKQYAHLFQGEYVFIPVNDNWLVIEKPENTDNIEFI